MARPSRSSIPLINMKTLIATLTLVLTSCAGTSFWFDSPHASGEGKDGTVIINPKPWPIIIDK